MAAHYPLHGRGRGGLRRFHPPPTPPKEGIISFNHELMLNIDPFLSNIAFIRTLGLTAMPIMGSKDDVVVNLSVAGHSFRI